MTDDPNYKSQRFLSTVFLQLFFGIFAAEVYRCKMLGINRFRFRIGHQFIEFLRWRSRSTRWRSNQHSMHFAFFASFRRGPEELRATHPLLCEIPTCSLRGKSEGA